MTSGRAADFNDPKVMAILLTEEGFIKWAQEGVLSVKDFRPQWAYLFKEVIAASLKR